MVAGSVTDTVDEENLADFLSNSYTPRDLKVKERIKPSKQLERSLISGMDSELVIPPEAKYDKRLSIYLNDTSSSSSEEENDVEDLDEDMDNYTINNNNNSSQTSSDEMNESSYEESDTKNESISQEQIHSILNDEVPPVLPTNNVENSFNQNVFEFAKKQLHPIRTPAAPLEVEDNPSLIRVNAESYIVDSDESEEEEEEEAETEVVGNEKLVPRLNFDARGPKPREEKPSFPDLCLYGEKKLKTCKGGAKDWLMPFRERLYFESTYEGPEKEIDFTDPIFYAPTGDIYSYFQRRQLYPHPFKMPTQYQVKKSTL
ncbi:unnamed protein product [Lepeophtheirus salmonis]|uniref:(salmon louse) hypothetical protein n=1 Tax=Lepeophtheirus salmonis TaxID=72036 RepID=A0A7R8CIT1_LEPSM|nr:unnamed protein product [Lepeophtheirus salmonis]CAF2804394.1 unnamed protein product [Lepeophtheirus salmonis]